MAHGLSDHKLWAGSNHELEVSGNISQRDVRGKEHRALPGPVGCPGLPPSTLVRPWTRKKTDGLSGPEHWCSHLTTLPIDNSTNATTGVRTAQRPIARFNSDLKD